MFKKFNKPMMLVKVLVLVVAARALIVTSADPVQPQLTSGGLFKQVKLIFHKGSLLPGSHLYMNGARLADYYTIDRVNKPGFLSVRTQVDDVKTFKDGSLLIKENFNKKKVLRTIAVMYKQKNYDPHDDNWVMALYKADGTSMGFGKLKACINCHAMASSSDFVFPPLHRLPVSVVKSFFPGQPISPVYVHLLKTGSN